MTYSALSFLFLISIPCQYRELVKNPDDILNVSRCPKYVLSEYPITTIKSKLLEIEE